MYVRRAAVVALALASSLSGVIAPAGAADQTVLGKSYVVKDPQPSVDPSLRTIVVLGKELTSDDSVVGNPINNGATVEVLANGASSTSQVFSMPAGPSVLGGPGWKALGTTGFGYKDAGGTNGPVKAATIKKSSSGTFVVKVTIKGALGPGPQPHVTVLPPAPGTDGGMRFTITGGDTYCVNFGPLVGAGGAVTNAPTHGTPNKTFKIASKPLTPTTEAGCPTPPVPTTSTTSTSTTSTTSTTCPSSPVGAILQGSLTATPGRFNYNLTLGLPGANSSCNTNFPGTHACTYAELQAAATACDLVGLKDTSLVTVTSFWAIDNSQPALQQCNDDALGGSGLNWEYATAHTASRGQRVPLNNSLGTLGALQSSLQCNLSGTSWVGCCL